MKEAELKKKEEAAKRFKNKIIAQLPKDEESLNKVSLIVEIAKMFSESKRKEA